MLARRFGDMWRVFMTYLCELVGFWESGIDFFGVVLVRLQYRAVRHGGVSALGWMCALLSSLVGMLNGMGMTSLKDGWSGCD